MRLIGDGVVEREGVPGLARHLGYTTRHLTRVLVSELGAGPLALARAHRAQTARTLLVGTDLSIADVAFAAGFSSIRQFNDTVQAVYEMTPSQMRSRWTRHNLATSTRSDARAERVDASKPADEAAEISPGSTRLTLRLPARAPFDGAGLMRFLADHAVPGLETASAARFDRPVRLPHGIGQVSIELDPSGTGIRCTARLDSVADVSTLVARVRRLFDLDADSFAIDEALRTDPTLAPLVAAVPGIRLPGSLDAEETLFRTLIGQQISVAAARTVLGRLTSELGTDGLFPTAVQLAEHGREVLRGPASRINTVVGVAEAIAGGELVLDVATPVDEFEANLVRLPGVGPWTAGYLAIRVLGNPDVLLTSDLVIQQSATALGLPGTAKGLAAHGERWAPWRSYAALHLWRARPVALVRTARTQQR
jgi:AraC family transcriptional regulator of adaptative response / DNA-3-methyladenine glycosylase II